MTIAGTLDDMVVVEGGTFVIGSDDHEPEEAPAHRVTVDGFAIDRFAVTNREFARFVVETGYVTVAERPLDPADYPGAPAENLVPGSMVFTPTRGPVDLRHLSQWWRWVPRASWMMPEGPRSTLEGRLDHPVVHVAYDDAAAFASWAGKQLPTETEWEVAARGGLEGAPFVWGANADSADQPLANYYRGDFPWRVERGFGTTRPVGEYPPNGYGLYDMAGNVWEWTDDWYADRRRTAKTESSCCVPSNPRGPDIEASFDPAQPQFRIPRKVIKGGSFLCADSYCRRYRPASRRPQMVDTGMSHIGFRCVQRTFIPAG